MSADRKTERILFAIGASIFSICATTGAIAQESIVLDFANPNVSVDFSVLQDGGVGPAISAPATVGGGKHLIPGANAPVSTLYITPKENFEPIEKIVLRKPEPEPEPVPEPEIVLEPKIVSAPEPVQTTKVKDDPTPPPAAPVMPVTSEKVPAKPKAVAPKVVKAEPKAPPPPPEPAKVPEPSVSVAKEPKKILEQQKTAEVVKPVKEKPLKLESKKEDKPSAPPAPPVVEEVKEVKAPPPPVVETPPAPAVEVPKITAKLPEGKPEVKEEPAPALASIAPTGPTLTDGYSMRVLFDPQSSKLPGTSRDELQGLASSMIKQDGLRLQLLAYAGGADMSSSSARRLSLSRALAVRSFLIESGVRSTRIDVRALGNKTTDAETERVDISVVER